MVTFTGTGVRLFGVFIRWYGIIIACAILLAVILCTAREKRYKLPAETCLNLALVAVPAGIIGARLYYVLFNLNTYLQNPIEILFIHEGGLAIYGGIIGGAAAVFIYCRVTKLSLGKIADLIAPTLALAQAMGRWGNYFNQEAYGRALTNKAWQFFPVAVQLDSGTWHYATFFYESVWCALIFAVLLIWEFTGSAKKDGDRFLAYIYLYAAERFIVEGLRMDSLMIGPLRVSQVLSFTVLVVLGIILCARGGNKGIILKCLTMISLILLACAAALLPFPLSAVFVILTTVITAITYRVTLKAE